MPPPPTAPARIWLNEIGQRNARTNGSLTEFFQRLLRPRELVNVHLPHLSLGERSNGRLYDQRQRIVGASKCALNIWYPEPISANQLGPPGLASGTSKVRFHPPRPPR